MRPSRCRRTIFPKKRRRLMKCSTRSILRGIRGPTSRAETTRLSPEDEEMVQNVRAVQDVQIIEELPGGLSDLNELNHLKDLKPLVEIQGVSKSFHKTVTERTTQIKALSDVSLSIRQNEFVSI